MIKFTAVFHPTGFRLSW